jgi:hypothetical protein
MDRQPWNAQLRLEEPAVRAYVHHAAVIVLAPGCRHLQAHADNQILLVVRELLKRQRGRAVEIDESRNSGLAKPLTVRDIVAP